MSTVIKVENLSKQYRLGLVGTSTFKEDTQRWWAKLRGKEDPFLRLGAENNRTIQSDDRFVWSLKDINFDIQQGEVVGILGKNGAGKSTLLKILSKVTAPTSGSIKVKGRMASLLEVGTGFHPELTGKENIFLNGAILGMRKHEINRKLDDIIDFAGVERYIDTPVKRYSSGMYVRLAFAVAAYLDSDILILDEILAVGDAEFQSKCINKIKDVGTSGKTVLFVSHNIASIQNLCTHGIVLNNGKIFSQKSFISDTISSYLNEITTVVSNVFSSNTNRVGNGKLNFIKYSILNNKFEEIKVVLSGQKLILRLYFNVNDQTCKKVQIAVSLNTKSGILISDLSTQYLGTNIFINKDKEYVDCIIERFPLMKGQYILNLMIRDGEDIIDYIQNAIILNVDNGDFFNSGFIPPESHNGFLFDYNFI